MVIYYSKINLVTDQIFEVYEDKNSLRKILSFVLSDMKNGVYYERTEDRIGDDGKPVKNKTRYNLRIRETTDEYVYGLIYKRSKIFYKDINAINGEFVTKTVENVEGISFYFDVFKETVGFYTTKRFGYKEFNEAFINILNTCLDKSKRKIKFDIALRTEGLSMDEVIEQLEKINKIRELKLKFQPPNPDEELLEKIQENGEQFVSKMNDANVTGMSYVFNSNGNEGLNLRSKMIMDNLENIKNLSYVVEDKKAIGRGYIAVEAIGTDGKKYTTADQRPLKSVISKLEEFKKTCKEAIKAIV